MVNFFIQKLLIMKRSIFCSLRKGGRSLKPVAAMAFLAVLGILPGRAWAQYTVDQSVSFGLETLTAPSSVFPADDQTIGPYNIGFSFEFFGTSYTQFYISSNGFLAFQNTSNGCCSGQFIPNTGQPNNMIAAFYEDFDPPEGGAIRYQTLGSVGSRILVLEFNGVYPWNGPPKTPSTWQIKLFECSNEIEIHCLSCVSDGGAITQGIENAAGTQAFFAPGRNSTNFSVYNDAVAFLPAGGGFSPISLADASGSVAEGVASGTTVTTLVANDPDGATNLQYSIVSGNDLGMFNLSSSGVLTTTGTVDYEAVIGQNNNNQIVLEVQVIDPSNSCRVDFADVTVTVNNVFENPYTLSQTSLSNLVSNANIAQSFLSTDEGALRSLSFYLNSSPGTVTLSLYEGAGLVARSGTAAKSEALIYSETFTGVGSGVQTLEPSIEVPIDANTVYTFQITAGSSMSAWYFNSDIYKPGQAYFGGAAQATRDLYFSVVIGSFNTAPVLNALDNVSVTENNDPGDAIAVAMATDADADNINYSLSGGGGYFVINNATGEITTNGSLDYEDIFANTTIFPLQYTLTVTATDNGSPAKSDSESFVVTILNEDDAPYTVGIATANITLNGNTSIGQSFTTTDAGSLTQFDIDVVVPPSSGTMTVQVWKNSDTNPTSGGTGPGHVETELVYTEIVPVSSAGIQTIVLAAPPALEANTVYSVEMFSLNLNLRYRSSNLYRRGRILWSNQLYGCCDLYFVATIGGGAGGAGGIDLIAPRNGENLASETGFYTFAWDDPAQEDGTTYSLHLRSDGNQDVVISGITGQSYDVNLRMLDSEKEYRWWLSIDDVDGESASNFFKTPNVSVTGLNDPLLAQPIEVFPNPFADASNVSYSLKEARDVSLEIYDLRGVKVRGFEEVPSSINGSFNWNGRNEQGGAVQAGMYMYRLVLTQDGVVDRVINGQMIKK